MAKTDLKKVATQEIESKPKKSFAFFSRKQLAIPYGVFLALFVVFPLLLIVYYAFTDKNTGAISLGNFIEFFTSKASLTNLIISVGVA
jgi:spermidine/putrescine transport system permease protein